MKYILLVWFALFWAPAWAQTTTFLTQPVLLPAVLKAL